MITIANPVGYPEEFRDTKISTEVFAIDVPDLIDVPNPISSIKLNFEYTK